MGAMIQPIYTSPENFPMNSYLLRFIKHYLSVVFATLMLVSVFAFLVIPYSLCGHPGEERVAEQGPTLVTVTEPQV